jgi:hypothetical protein
VQREDAPRLEQGQGEPPRQPVDEREDQRGPAFAPTWNTVMNPTIVATSMR